MTRSILLFGVCIISACGGESRRDGGVRPGNPDAASLDVSSTDRDAGVPDTEPLEMECLEETFACRAAMNNCAEQRDRCYAATADRDACDRQAEDCGFRMVGRCDQCRCGTDRCAFTCVESECERSCYAAVRDEAATCNALCYAGEDAGVAAVPFELCNTDDRCGCCHRRAIAEQACARDVCGRLTEMVATGTITCSN